MNQYHTIIHSLQLLVDDHDDENDLMMICKVFCEIIIESCFEIFKSVAKLNNVAVISKLHDV